MLTAQNEWALVEKIQMRQRLVHESNIGIGVRSGMCKLLLCVGV